MFRAIRETITGEVAKSRLNRQFERYGTIQKLVIDSRRKRIELTGTLRGDRVPVEITVSSYSIAEANGETWAKIDACSCSLPWLQHVIEDHVRTRAFKVPRWLKLFL